MSAAEITKRPHVRWMIRGDMDEVCAIEKATFEYPWSEDDFIRCLRSIKCIGMVAVDEHHVVMGYMLYELHKTHLHLLNFAVSDAFRRQKIGTVMIDKLIGKLTEKRRTNIQCEVRETNTEAQLFFRSAGFEAKEVLPLFFEEANEDAYLMKYTIEDLPVINWKGKSRFTL